MAKYWEKKRLRRDFWMKSSCDLQGIAKILKKRKVWWAIVVCHGVIIAQQLSGINTMIFYALLIFNMGGSGDLSGEELTLVVGGVQILSCLLCTLTVDRIGRRILLTVSAASTGISLILLGKLCSWRKFNFSFNAKKQKKKTKNNAKHFGTFIVTLKNLYPSESTKQQRLLPSNKIEWKKKKTSYFRKFLRNSESEKSLI